MALPAPPFPPPDTDRAVDELRTDVSIYKKTQKLDARVASMLRTKAACLASDLHREEESHAEDLKMLGNAHSIAKATIEYELTKMAVEIHRWRQRNALLKVKLSAAEEDLQRHHRLAALMKTQNELEASARRAVGQQNEVLRQRILDMQDATQAENHRVGHLHAQLVSQAAALEDRDGQLQEARAALALTGEQAQAQLDAAQAEAMRLQQQLGAAHERIALAEQAAATAQERAKLSEQMLQQREALASERERLQAEVQGFSKDMAKMAMETGSAANSQLQQTIAEAQAALLAERTARAQAEARVAGAEARAKELDREVVRLERQVESKERRIEGLEDALRNREATPARAVTQAMDVVGALVSQLDGTPGTDLAPSRHTAALPMLGRMRGVGAGKEDQPDARPKPKQQRKAKETVAAVLSPVAEDEGGEDAGFDVSPELDFGPGGAKGRKGRQAGGRAKQQQQEEEDAGQAGKRPRRQPRAAASASTLPAEPEQEEGGADLQAAAAAAKPRRGSGKRKQAEVVYAEEEEEEGDEDGQQAAASKAVAVRKKKKVGGGAGKKDVGGGDQLLQEVWGDDDQLEAQRTGRPTGKSMGAKSGPAPPEEKENPAGSMLDAGTTVASNMAAQPLAALHPSVLAAAENRAQPAGPPKPALQKSILARPLGGGNAGAQPGKRRLLGVSSTSLNVVSDALPASMLFGNNFKVPKLQGK